MLFKLFALSVMTSFALQAFAEDICLWNGVQNGVGGRGCVGAGQCCRSIPAGACCIAGPPYNQYVALYSNVAGRDLYGYNYGGCSRTPAANIRCGAGECCVMVGSQGSAAGQWYRGQGGKRGWPKRQEPAEGKGCYLANEARYVDDAGVHQSVRLTDDNREHFDELWEAQNFTGLAEFPKWED